MLVTVRAAETLEDFTGEPAARRSSSPGGRGHQVINEAPGRPVRAPLFAEVAPR